MDDAPTRRQLHPVVAGGLVLVLLFTALRAWSLSRSWFFLDDFLLLHQSREEGLDPRHLLTPFNGHVMPAGHALTWLVGRAPGLSWPVAAVVLTVLQAAMASSALWMFVVVFGRRWGVLLPLALFLSCAGTMPATMWWVANVNQVPVVTAMFLATGAWVQYLRSRRTAWVAATLAALALGLAFDTKALLIVIVIGLVSLWYFASGGPVRRARHVLRRYPLGVALVAGASSAYVAAYVASVDSPIVELDAGVTADVAAHLFGTAFPTAFVGGPWRWTADTPVYADPWPLAVHVAWVALALAVVATALLRRRSLRAWSIFGVHALVVLGLLATSRATAYGPDVGLELRFATDCIAVWALSVGLATMSVPGAVESSTPRAAPYLTLRPRPVVLAWVAALVAALGVQSTVAYAGSFDRANEGRDYVETLDRALDRVGRVDMAEGVVPRSVIDPLSAPDNKVSLVAGLLGRRAAFPPASSRLAVVAASGDLHLARVEPGVTAQEGPLRDCGWAVGEEGRDIPLTSQAFPWRWWGQVGYLASADSPVTVSAGGSTVETDVQRGLNTLYVMLDGTFDEVRIDGLDDGVTVCVDTVVVGQPVPGEVLE